MTVLSKYATDPAELLKRQTAALFAGMVYEKTEEKVRAYRVRDNRPSHRVIEKEIIDAMEDEAERQGAEITKLIIQSGKYCDLNANSTVKFSKATLSDIGTCVVYLETKCQNYYSMLRRTILLTENDEVINAWNAIMTGGYNKLCDIVRDEVECEDVREKMKVYIEANGVKKYTHHLFASPIGETLQDDQVSIKLSKAPDMELEENWIYGLVFGFKVPANIKKETKSVTFVHADSVVINKGKGVTTMADFQILEGTIRVERATNPSPSLFTSADALLFVENNDLSSVSSAESEDDEAGQSGRAAFDEPHAMPDGELRVFIGGMVKRK